MSATVGGPAPAREEVTIPLITTAVTANFSGDAATIDAGATLSAMDGAKFSTSKNPAFVEVAYQGGSSRSRPYPTVEG